MAATTGLMVHCLPWDALAVAGWTRCNPLHTLELSPSSTEQSNEVLQGLSPTNVETVTIQLRLGEESFPHLTQDIYPLYKISNVKQS